MADAGAFSTTDGRAAAAGGADALDAVARGAAVLTGAFDDGDFRGPLDAAADGGRFAITDAAAVRGASGGAWVTVGGVATRATLGCAGDLDLDRGEIAGGGGTAGLGVATLTAGDVVVDAADASGADGGTPGPGAVEDGDACLVGSMPLALFAAALPDDRALGAGSPAMVAPSGAGFRGGGNGLPCGGALRPCAGWGAEGTGRVVEPEFQDHAAHPIARIATAAAAARPSVRPLPSLRRSGA